jgi:hypothetical protein
VVREPVERHRRLLSDEQRELIERACGELYRDALTLTGPATAG